MTARSAVATMSAGLVADSRSVPGIVPVAGRIEGFVVEVEVVDWGAVVTGAPLLKEDVPHAASATPRPKKSVRPLNREFARNPLDAIDATVTLASG